MGALLLLVRSLARLTAGSGLDPRHLHFDRGSRAWVPA